MDRVANDLGWAALTFTFRGCGNSEGDFSMQGWVDDLRAAIDHLEDEVSPDKTFYMKDPLRSNFFLETKFHPLVEWDSILEFIQTKKLYTRYGNERKISETEGAYVRTPDQRLF
jgi:hypothetical protein